MTYSDPEKRRAYHREYYHKKLAPGGEKYEDYRTYQREYYREQLGVGGEKHEQYIEKHRKYNKTYQKGESYKVGKRERDNVRYQREKESILERRRQKQQPIIAWYKHYKTTVHCIRCGENDPVCLHFHHRNRADKKSNIASYVFAASSLEKFIAELHKCDVL
jgi:hypothetical protein